MGSSDYRLDISHPSGPPFDLVYNGSFDFNLFDNTAEATPPAFDVGQTVFVHLSHVDHPSSTATILTVPVRLSSPHSLQLTDSGDIVVVAECEIMPHNPTAIIDTTNIVLTHPWIQHGAKTTLFLPEVMLTPKQDFLLKHNDDSWSFHPGCMLKKKSTRNNLTGIPLPTCILLPHFNDTAESLVNSKHIIQGWQHYKTFNHNLELQKTHKFLARRTIYFKSSDPCNLSDANTKSSIASLSNSNIISSGRRVSAAGLDSLLELKLTDHKSMSKDDKEIWDKLYLEEYLGLHETTHTIHTNPREHCQRTGSKQFHRRKTHCRPT